MLEIKDCDEQKPKYEPLEDITDFLNAYRRVQTCQLKRMRQEMPDEDMREL